MPLPLLLAGAAILAGGYGVKKGIDAKSDFSKADSLNSQARSVYREASDGLDAAREQAQNALMQLGKLKFSIYESKLIPFVEAFSQIKDIDFQDEKLKEEFKLAGVSGSDLRAIERSAVGMQQVVTGGVTALGAGGLAGLAAYGGVGTLATTAGGTAIGSLGGAAATNATLAWLGGGALSAGGFGMAGGAAVLGGIVAGPVLAVGGMMLASKAEEARHNASSNLNKARMAAEEMQTATVATGAIQKRFAEIASVLKKLNKEFAPMLEGLQQRVAAGKNYKRYSRADKTGVMMAAALAKTIKNVMEAPVIDKDGALTAESRKVIAAAKLHLAELEQA
ncbi:hypothetical protein SAMN05216319_2784 [Duganella sp. CF402]|uniref:hypothetical protein n=1 Tax=unclassified Duganella TaxID=2636909 RepID=UPI0008BB7141|nr:MULTISPECIES: hypothetical protein [unclassified Duganella]RZT08800.1 hypothetical protein EV582_0837 [Duganella sp. BK701]SEL81498.1 hypothetical protein SAMN05216319_2784 [Duganella sp. CF402]